MVLKLSQLQKEYCPKTGDKNDFQELYFCAVQGTLLNSCILPCTYVVGGGGLSGLAVKTHVYPSFLCAIAHKCRKIQL